MSTTIVDMRTVVGQLVGQVTGQADTLNSNATRSLLLTSIATLALLLVLLTAAVLTRPPRRQQAGPLDAVWRDPGLRDNR